MKDVQLAEKLGVSQQSVTKTKKPALNKLREEMKQYGKRICWEEASISLERTRCLIYLEKLQLEISAALSHTNFDHKEDLKQCLKEKIRILKGGKNDSGVPVFLMLLLVPPRLISLIKENMLYTK